MTSTTLAAALDYAARGWAVLPLWWPQDDKSCACGNPVGRPCKAGKHPIGSLVPHGVKDATKDASTVREWWERFPDANVGIATGAASDLYVVDLDGAEGTSAWSVLEERYGATVTRTVRTGSGYHLYFRHRSGMGNGRGSLPDRIDTRGDGGYVVAPPSRHASGETYAWDDTAGKVAIDLPAWAWHLITTPKSLPPKSPSVVTGPTFTATQGTPYGVAALREIHDELASAPAGGRDNLLVAKAYRLGRLVAGGTVTEDEAVRALVDACQRNGLAAEMGEEELLGKIRRGMEAGAAKGGPALPSDATGRLDTRPVVSDASTGQGEAPAGIVATPALPRSVSVEDLLAEPEPDVNPLWAGVVEPGALTLVVGWPKAGKTWLAVAFAAAAARADEWLGRTVPATRALFVTEESPRTMRRLVPRFDLTGAALVTRREAGPLLALPWSARVEWMVAEARAKGCGMLVLDPLAFWAGFGESQENDASAVVAAMHPLLLAAGSGLAIVVLHHARKTDGAHGTAARGSNAIVGSVDAVLEVRPWDEDGDPRRKLRILGRLVDPESAPRGDVIVSYRSPGGGRPAGFDFLGSGMEARAAEIDNALVAAAVEAPDLDTDDLIAAAGVQRKAGKARLRALLGRRLARSGTGKQGDPYRWRVLPGASS